jgi:uroporphyrinogen decarboxylase
MDKFDRLYGAMKNEAVDLTPVSLWLHFPNEDRTPEGLAKAELRFQKEFDVDLMKISPHGRYCVIDWGGKAGPVNPISGSTSTLKPVLNKPEDYTTLEKVDPLDGEFGRQIKAVELINQEIEGTVPSMMTVFTPLMVASNLDPNLENHLREDPESVKTGLATITKVMTGFAKASIEAGANGIFLATKHCTSDQLDLNEFKAYGAAYDTQIIKHIKPKAKFIVLHLHGENLYFEYAAKNYDVEGINWHSQATPPSLQQATTLFPRALLGGIEEEETLRKGTPNQVKTQVREAINSVSTNQLIVSPGCVIPIDAPMENLHAVIEETRKKD